MSFIVAAFSYLLGSMVTGILYSHLRGDDIRNRDLPGGSGTFRQYGRTAAILVTLGDALRGALAVALTRMFAPDLVWLAVTMVVLGHCYPVFFGFRGGGGIATLLGALLVAAPKTGLGMLAFGLLVIPVYKATLQKRLRLNAVPFATALALPFGFLLAQRYGGRAEVLGGGLVMGIRAVHMLFEDQQEQA